MNSHRVTPFRSENPIRFSGINRYMFNAVTASICSKVVPNIAREEPARRLKHRHWVKRLQSQGMFFGFDYFLPPISKCHKLGLRRIKLRNLPFLPLSSILNFFPSLLLISSSRKAGYHSFHSPHNLCLVVQVFYAIFFCIL